MNIHTYLSKISFLTIFFNTTSFGMITVSKLHSQRWQQQNLLKKRPFFFPTSPNGDKSLLLLKNEPESQEELLYDNMLSSDLKNVIMSNLDFKSALAYWCTNKENNIVGHFNWRQRNKLHRLLPENFNGCTSKISFIYKDPKKSVLQKGEHDSLTAAIVTRSHEQLKKILKKRECYISFHSADGNERNVLFKKSTHLAKLLAIQVRNMAAIELLLEHQCNVHNIDKESFKKFYNIQGYKNYLDVQVKKILKKIEKSFKSSDVEYFKLLVKCMHPDIINHPIQPETFIQNIYGIYDTCTILDYVYGKCDPYLYQFESKILNELNWSLINYLEKYGALEYQEVMASPSQTHPYGFKLPQDYHETGFIIRDTENLMCYWVHPDLLNSTSPANNSPITT